MKLKCINQGNFKSIIIDGEYHATLNADGTRYQIQIAGVEREYALKYFEVIADPIPDIIEDVEEVGVVEDEISVKFDGEGDINLEINDNKVLLEFYEVAYNFGVKSYHGINYLFENCDHNPVLFEKVIQAIIEETIDRNNSCMLIFSTNKTYPEIWTALDNVMDFGSLSVENPNSDLQVKLWIKYTN